jgi:NitT/TauT family transport system permease protein/sulfonate transport system permease protein
MVLGFIIGGAVGTMLGIVTGRSRLANASLTPLLQLMRPLPPVAIIPLVIVWLGIGNTAKVFSIAFAVFFPVWVNTHLGAAAIPSAYLWSARLLSKSKMRIARRVVLPAAFPSIFAGLRVSISIAFIMVYVSEIAGASAGIGYQISVCHLAYRIDKMMAALVVLAGAGALADLLFATGVRLAFPWMSRAMKR